MDGARIYGMSETSAKWIGRGRRSWRSAGGLTRASQRRRAVAAQRPAKTKRGEWSRHSGVGKAERACLGGWGAPTCVRAISRGSPACTNGAFGPLWIITASEEAVRRERIRRKLAHLARPADATLH